jgi:hypothetical protein
MNDALFDLPDLPQIKHAPPPENLSQDQKRTRRQADILAAGYHPLGLVIGIRVRLHEDAAPISDRKAGGLRCRGCRFRQVFGHHTRSYGKCVQASVSHSAASDNRAWWPACVRFQPKNGDS